MFALPNPHTFRALLNLAMLLVLGALIREALYLIKRDGRWLVFWHIIPARVRRGRSSPLVPYAWCSTSTASYQRARATLASL